MNTGRRRRRPTATTAMTIRKTTSGQVSESGRYGTKPYGFSMAWTTPCLIVASRIRPNTPPTT
jgi:hypothetical protein